jgi:predicted nucleic acid-binding Zn ribbon protein
MFYYKKNQLDTKKTVIQEMRDKPLEDTYKTSSKMM